MKINFFEEIRIYNETSEFYINSEILDSKNRIKYINIGDKFFFEKNIELFFKGIKEKNSFYDIRNYNSIYELSNDILNTKNYSESGIIVYVSDKNSEEINYILNKIKKIEDIKNIVFMGCIFNNYMEFFNIDYNYNIKLLILKNNFHPDFLDVFIKSLNEKEYFSIDGLCETFDQKIIIKMVYFLNFKKIVNEKIKLGNIKLLCFHYLVNNEIKYLSKTEKNTLNIISYYSLFTDKKILNLSELSINNKNEYTLNLNEVLELLKIHDVLLDKSEIYNLIIKIPFLFNNLGEDLFYIKNYSVLSYFSFLYIKEMENLNILKLCFYENILINKYNEMLIFLVNFYLNSDIKLRKKFYDNLFLNENGKLKRLIPIDFFNIDYMIELEGLIFINEIDADLKNIMYIQDDFSEQWVKEIWNKFQTIPMYYDERYNYKNPVKRNFVFFEQYFTKKEAIEILEFFKKPILNPYYELYKIFNDFENYKLIKKEIEKNETILMNRLKIVLIYYFERKFNKGNYNLNETDFIFERNNMITMHNKKIFNQHLKLIKKNSSLMDSVLLILDNIENELCQNEKIFLEHNFNFTEKKENNRIGRPKKENVISDNIKSIIINNYDLIVTREEETSNNRKIDFILSTKNVTNKKLIIEAKLFNNRDMLNSLSNGSIKKYIENQILFYMKKENQKESVYLIYSFEDKILENNFLKSKEKYEKYKNDIINSIELINSENNINIKFKEIVFKLK